MLPTFRQQFPPGLLTQVAQHVQLLIESFGSTAHAGFPEFRSFSECFRGLPSARGGRETAEQRGGTSDGADHWKTRKLENKVENKNCRMRASSPIFEPLARL